MKDTYLSVLTRAPIGEPPMASELVRLIVSHHPDLEPKRYGSYEPLPHRMDGPIDVQLLLQAWRSPFFWESPRRADVTFQGAR